MIKAPAPLPFTSDDQNSPLAMEEIRSLWLGIYLKTLFDRECQALDGRPQEPEPAVPKDLNVMLANECARVAKKLALARQNQSTYLNNHISFTL